MNNDPILFIAGPTASGKSELAMRIAKDFSGEIVNGDSMQFYRGLEIGVAKPDAAERYQVPHHLIDILDINEAADVFAYVEKADKIIAEIHSAGRLPLLVGGSGLYLRSLIYGLDPLPANPELRVKLDAEYASEEGFLKLKEFMRLKDPEDYEKWQKDQRKLIRAREVFELTGKSIISLQSANSKPRENAIVWKLEWDREELKKRIRARTVKMLESGWIKETESLLEKGFLSTPTARQAIGYAVIAEYLEGRIDYELMREKIITATWQFARRQITWLKGKHPEAESIRMPCNYADLKEKLSSKLDAYANLHSKRRDLR